MNTVDFQAAIDAARYILYTHFVFIIAWLISYGTVIYYLVQLIYVAYCRLRNREINRSLLNDFPVALKSTSVVWMLVWLTKIAFPAFGASATYKQLMLKALLSLCCCMVCCILQEILIQKGLGPVMNKGIRFFLSSCKKLQQMFRGLCGTKKD